MRVLSSPSLRETWLPAGLILAALAVFAAFAFRVPGDLRLVSPEIDPDLRRAVVRTRVREDVRFLGFVPLPWTFYPFLAAVVGTLIPIALKTSRVDPAIASSVIITTFTDVFGFFSFLGLATLFGYRLSRIAPRTFELNEPRARFHSRCVRQLGSVLVADNPSARPRSARATSRPSSALNRRRRTRRSC